MIQNKGAPLTGRAATPDGAEPVVSGQAGIPSAGQMQFLLTMVEFDITREGETASFMVRSGLLRDILVFAIAMEASGRDGETRLDAKHESAAIAQTHPEPRP